MDYTIKSDLKILVIGDLMIDHYIYGNCNRISPEAPVQVVEVQRDFYTLGGAGNVLQNLIAFKTTAYIIAVVGIDEGADQVASQLSQAGISSKYLIKDVQRCTTIKSRVMVQSHQLIRLDREITTPIGSYIEATIMAMIEDQVNGCDMVLLSDYNKGLLPASLLAKIFEICRLHGIKTLLDPKGTDFLKYRGVNIIKPNKKEAVVASGINITDTESLRDACIKLQEITNCDSVIITMSEDGIAMFTNNILEVIPTKALDVVDVTGAGDTVLASLAVALASGNTLYNACDFANQAAAIVVSKVGSATATLQEVEQNFKNH